MRRNHVSKLFRGPFSSFLSLWLVLPLFLSSCSICSPSLVPEPLPDQLCKRGWLPRHNITTHRERETHKYTFRALRWQWWWQHQLCPFPPQQAFPSRLSLPSLMAVRKCVTTAFASHPPTTAAHSIN